MGKYDASGAAYGSYDSGANHPSNFGVLKINTNKDIADSKQMFAAGYLEAALTVSDIFAMYSNMLTTWPEFKDGPPENLTKFLQEQV